MCHTFDRARRRVDWFYSALMHACLSPSSPPEFYLVESFLYCLGFYAEGFSVRRAVLDTESQWNSHEYTDSTMGWTGYLLHIFQLQWIWKIYFGCKVGQHVLSGMKFDLDVWHCVINIYDKFQIDISNRVEKAPGKIRKCAKIITKIPNIRLLLKTELMPRSIQWSTYVPNFKDLSWFMRPWLPKMNLTYFWL